LVAINAAEEASRPGAGVCVGLGLGVAGGAQGFATPGALQLAVLHAATLVTLLSMG
jgi:hypothetical protein